jgi:RHS repeat-associated protein
MPLLCQYHYDALDQLIGHTPANEAQLQRFYCKSRLATEIQGALRHSIVQHGDLLLAQQRSAGDARDTTLLATDQQRSVLQILKGTQPPLAIAYSPYGHRCTENGLLSLLGFNGERPDPVTGYYLLGNGYRAFTPVLMRFNSPDSLSPFGQGGLNPYAYCLGDPVNFSDSSGQSPVLKKAILSLFKSASNSRRKYLTRHGFREHPKIERRLSSPNPTTRPLTEPDFLGYHGTSKESVEKLLKEGVQPHHAYKMRNRPGFYFTPDIEVTFEYARKQSMRSAPSSYNTKNFGKNNIVEVHIQNLTGMTPGKDYDFNHYQFRRTRPEHMTMEFYARPHIARAVIIRQLGSTPAANKVRPRAHEAPF